MNSCDYSLRSTFHVGCEDSGWFVGQPSLTGLGESSPSSVQDGLHTPEGSLFDTDDHRIGADQTFYSDFAESCFLHPSGAVSAGVVKPVGGFDQHIQAHQQSKSVVRAIIIDDAFVDNVCAAVR